jgi:hypothetical protein
VWTNYKYVEKFVLKTSNGEKMWATEGWMGGEEWVKSLMIL